MQFRQLLFNHHSYLVKFLHSKRNSLQYIARHFFDELRVERKGKDYLSFRMKVEQGSDSFIPNATQNNRDYIDLLIRHGSTQLLNWIACFIKGIV